MKNVRKVKVNQSYIDQIKKERDDYKEKLRISEEDLTEHRNYVIYLLREVTLSHGKGNNISSTWLIESIAKHLNKVKRWYW